MNIPVDRVPVDRGPTSAQLPGWDYADAYEITAGRNGPADARTAARCLFDLSATGRATLRARDALARITSLKPAVTDAAELFPMQYVAEDLAVLGLDDRHLDFRVLVSVTAGRVRCTTAVRRHNALGYAYFAAVTPFHRLAVPRLLARAAQRGWRAPEGGGRVAPSGPVRA
jgi:Protein of unknown function (DUF2867)